MSGRTTPAGVTVGVLGMPWRGSVDAGGAVIPWGVRDAQPRLDWWVAAEDRWHDPQRETSVRQRRIEGTPVVETRVRVPGGDVVHRVFAVADAGGVTVIEVENESAAAVAVVFSHGELLSLRPPTDAEVAGRTVDGIELPPTAVSFPIAHRSSIRVGLAHQSGGTAARASLPDGLSGAVAVARGWLRQTEAASRLVLPDALLVEQLTGQRCEIVLGHPDDLADDPAAALIALGERVRMGADPVALVGAIATDAERLARSARRCGLDWDGATALAAAQRMLLGAGDDRAASDVADIRRRLGGGGAPPPETAPAGPRFVPWVEQRLARPVDDGGCVLLADGFPREWLGANFEVHNLPAGPRSAVGYAVRWHGERPAVLWEVSGDAVELRGGASSTSWSTHEAHGEALWPQP